MTEVKIAKFDELLKEFEREKESQNFVFRGHSNSNYELKTSLGRCDSFYGRTIQQLEKRLLKLFKESSLPYLEHKPSSELEWLAVAQHFGLPTRLLDWSYNPLVATYFAVEDNPEDDGALFMLSGCSTIQNPDTFKIGTLKKVQKYRPPYITSRIQNQSGLFTIHNNPEEVFTHEKMKKVIIPKEVKRDIKRTLFKYGINQRMIYPGLEGIAKDLKWLETSIY